MSLHAPATTPIDSVAPIVAPTKSSDYAATPPAPMRRTLVIAGLALAVSTALTLSIARPNRVRFPAQLSASKQIVSAPFTGTIETRNIEPGQFVCPDHVLFTVVDSKLESRRTALESEIQQLEQDLCSAQASANVDAGKSLDAVEAEIFHTENSLAEHIGQKYIEQMRAKAWGDQHSMLMDALASTQMPQFEIRMLSPQLQHPTFQIEAMLKEAEAENRAEAIQTRIEISETRLKALRGRRTELPKQFHVAARVPQIEQELQQARDRLANLQPSGTIEAIKASIYGMVGNVKRTVHEEVQATEILVEVFDRDEEFLLATIPARLATTLKPGLKVQVHFPDEPVREGEVEAVPPQASSKPSDEPQLEVRILPTGRVWPAIPIGSTVQVSLK